jgi:hypothetical protein
MLFIPVFFGWLGEEKDLNPKKARDEFFDILRNAVTCGSYQGKFAIVDDVESTHSSKDMKDGQMVVSTNPKLDGHVEEKHTYSAREEYLNFGKLYLLAIVISVIVFSAGFIFSEYGDNKDVTIPTIVVCIGGICSALYVLMRPITTDLAYGAMYIFLRNALPASGGNTMLFWNTDTSENDSENDYNECGPAPTNYTAVLDNLDRVTELENGTDMWGLDRPCLSTSFVTSIDSLGGVMGLVGIALYVKFLSHWSYKKIFLATAVIGFAFNFLDFIWVSKCVYTYIYITYLNT